MGDLAYTPDTDGAERQADKTLLLASLLDMPRHVELNTVPSAEATRPIPPGTHQMRVAWVSYFRIRPWLYAL